MHALPPDAPRRRGVGSVLLACLLATAIVAPAGGADSHPTTAPESTTAPASTTAEASAVAPDPILRVALDRSAALSGDPVTATVTLHNPGPAPLRLRCARPIEAWVDLSNMIEGPRADWRTSDPWRRPMRKRLLGDPRQGEGPLAVPLSPSGRSPACADRAVVVTPGETLTMAFSWKVGWHDGTPLFGTDDDPIVVRARASRAAAGAHAAVDESVAEPVLAAAMPLSVASARARRTLPPAWAIEALFENPTAAAWLDLEHVTSWRRAILRLVRGRWQFEVRREATGCCREELTAAVDASNGSVVALSAPRYQWSAARTRVSYFETLVLRLELQRSRFRDGRNTRMRMTVTNLDDEDAVWYWSHDNDCTPQPGLWIAAGPDVYGARWRGKLGVFKRRALRSEVILGRAGPPTRHQCRQPRPIMLGPLASVTTESFFRPQTIPTGQRTLQAVGRIDLVGPAPNTVRAWRVYASPTVRAGFRTGDGSQQLLSPAMLIDQALNDRAFARAIQRTPIERWRDAGVTGTSVWLELTNGRRIVGLP